MKNAILIVDDSRLNRETLAAILKDKYNIIEAEDGRGWQEWSGGSGEKKR